MKIIKNRFLFIFLASLSFGCASADTITLTATRYDLGKLISINWTREGDKCEKTTPLFMVYGIQGNDKTGVKLACAFDIGADCTLIENFSLDNKHPAFTKFYNDIRSGITTYLTEDSAGYQYDVYTWPMWDNLGNGTIINKISLENTPCT